MNQAFGVDGCDCCDCKKGFFVGNVIPESLQVIVSGNLKRLTTDKELRLGFLGGGHALTVDPRGQYDTHPTWLGEPAHWTLSQIAEPCCEPSNAVINHDPADDITGLAPPGCGVTLLPGESRTCSISYLGIFSMTGLGHVLTRQFEVPITFDSNLEDVLTNLNCSAITRHFRVAFHRMSSGRIILVSSITAENIGPVTNNGGSGSLDLGNGPLSISGSWTVPLNPAGSYLWRDQIFVPPIGGCRSGAMTCFSNGGGNAQVVVL